MSRKYMKAIVVCAAVIQTPSASAAAQVSAKRVAEHRVVPSLQWAELQLETLVPALELAEASLLGVEPALATAGVSLAVAAPIIDGMAVRLASTPFVPGTMYWRSDSWFPQDTADAIYRRGRSAMSSGNYRQAADLFRTLQNQYAQSRYVQQAMYYQAFSLYRLQDEAAYRTALSVLDQYRSRFPRVQTSDAENLYIRIQGQLAQRGDSEAAAAVAQRASELATAPVLAAPPWPGVWAPSQSDDDVRMQALNALLQMDAENAIPILRDVLANKDPDRVHLRRRAVFLVAQKRTEGREEILLEAARNDPDLEVREQAVQWLSQVRTDQAVAALDSILQSSTERSLQQRAIFALSQHRSERAVEILRDYALRPDVDVELRSRAIQWIGQKRGNAEFLRDLYPRLENGDLKERTLFALAQRRSEESAQFLLGIAMDESENMRMRTRALFWAGQMRGVTQDLYSLYGRVDNREMKEQLIAVYGQRRRDSLAVDQLIDIARTETDNELRSKAIFWLGQTRDPRAVEVLREIINR